MMFYGYSPVRINYINHNKNDMRIENLRAASHSELGATQRISCINTSSYKGVHFCDNTKRWRARIMSDGKTVHLGRFDTPEEAHQAYCEAAKELYGEFANFG
jgi:hypothetical protein